ncbi:coiled-coil and C2 domain-containing protein 1-like [Watersipora subatra]|uniref:coiled-coil and C2 domain-containing protein 1-like n=1 Tax=Watersipora subatra TaxID=2589382 RepID=UPI00355B98A6
MAPKKNKDAGKKSKGDDFMKQMGLLGPGDDSDDEIDLEAELLKLGGSIDSPKSRKPKKKEPMVDVDSLHAMASSIATDIGSDEELSGEDDDFLAELEALGSGEEGEDEASVSPPKQQAKKPSAESQRPAMKAPTGQKPVAAAIATAAVEKVKLKATSTEVPSTKPSPVSATKPIAVSTAELPSTSSTTTLATSENKLVMLRQRRAQYNNAAVKSKQSGDETLARKYIRIRKDFDKIIEAVQSGQDVDLSNMPPAPPEVAPSQQTPVKPAAPRAEPSTSAVTEKPEESIPDEKPEALSPGDTIASLQARLEKYKESEAQAKEQENSSKARRMGRIVKQYTDAIKATKAGRNFEYAELPVPPGFGPLAAPVASAKPTGVKAPAQSSGVKAPAQPSSAVPSPVQSQPAPAESRPQCVPVQGQSQASPDKKMPDTATKSSEADSVKHKSLKRQATLSIQGKQLDVLQQRHSQYKQAALEAKKHDDMELAKKYMRIAKGMNPMIQAATNGLPVDMAQIPPEPAGTHDTGYVVVDESEIAEVGDEARTEEFAKIVKQLQEQIKTSSDNAIHFKALGDVKNSCVFETYEQNSRKDLDAVQNALRHNDPPPKYHYETRQYTIVKVNTDLGDSDLQLNIVKGIQFPLPPEIKAANDLDTQIFYEFAWPQDAVQKGHSEYARHSDNPEYNHIAMLKIDRRSKSMLRMFKSRKLKLEIFYRRGFLKSDRHFASVSIKLDKLESAATVHESFDLLDTNARKEVGGKLEVILRLREPLVNKQVEVMKDRWLVIDQFVRLNKPVHKDAAPKQTTERLATSVSQQVSNVKLQSLQVLRYEKKELDARIRQLSTGGQISQTDLQKLTQKSSEMADQIDGINMMFKRNQLSQHDYIQVLTQIHGGYAKAMQQAAQAGDRRRQQILGAKKDIVHREIREMQGRALGKS